MGKTKPLVFISHKHSDSAIATVVAKFLRDRSLGQVECSSLRIGPFEDHGLEPA